MVTWGKYLYYKPDNSHRLYVLASHERLVAPKEATSLHLG